MTPHLGVVGVGTSVPKYNLEVGLVGMGSTAFQVNGDSRFVGLTTTCKRICWWCI